MVDYCSSDESRMQIKYCHHNTTITYLCYVKFKVWLKCKALRNYIFWSKYKQFKTHIYTHNYIRWSEVEWLVLIKFILFHSEFQYWIIFPGTKESNINIYIKCITLIPYKLNSNNNGWSHWLEIIFCSLQLHWWKWYTNRQHMFSV